MLKAIKSRAGLFHLWDKDYATRAVPVSACGAIDPYSRGYSVHDFTSLGLRNSVITCKNCLRSIGVKSDQPRKDPNQALIDTMKQEWKEIKHRRAMMYMEENAQPSDPPRNKKAIAAFQLSGMCVYLYKDGTWEWQDTSGG